MLKNEKVRAVAETLKKQVGADRYLDVGPGAQEVFDISRQQFNLAVREVLKDDRYVLFGVWRTRSGTRQRITTVLTPAEATQEDVNLHFERITPVCAVA